MQFTNAARTINDKFKTTVDRVSKLEAKINEFFESSGSLKKLADQDGDDEDLNDLRRSSINANLQNIDLSQYATNQGLQDFKSTV